MLKNCDPAAYIYSNHLTNVRTDSILRTHSQFADEPSRPFTSDPVPGMAIERTGVEAESILSVSPHAHAAHGGGRAVGQVGDLARGAVL